MKTKNLLASLPVLVLVVGLVPTMALAALTNFQLTIDGNGTSAFYCQIGRCKTRSMIWT